MLSGACLGLWALVLTLALPRAARAAACPDCRREYHRGVALYSQGRLAQALAVFRDVEAREPGDRPARLAARRVARELASVRRAPRLPPAARPAQSQSALDDLLLRAAAWFDFDRLVGDRLSGAGALAAACGRVRQLLAERRLALSRHRPFARERELRAMIRRLPVVA